MLGTTAAVSKMSATSARPVGPTMRASTAQGRLATPAYPSASQWSSGSGFRDFDRTLAKQLGLGDRPFELLGEVD
jgi:hypothetical protein